MSNRKLNYSIRDEYRQELSDINGKLQQIEDLNVYDLNNDAGSGSMKHNINQLRAMISELLSKIQNGNDGTEAKTENLFVG